MKELFNLLKNKTKRKIIFIITGLITAGITSILNGYISLDSIKSYNSQEKVDIKDLSVIKNRDFAKPFINEKICDKVINNRLITTCYSLEHKSVIKVAYVIDGSLVHKKNIKKRGTWKYNSNLKKSERSKNSDYVGTGFDKGHLAPDSAFDFNSDILEDTYDLNINAVPMYAKTNRKTWIKSESYSKKIANKLGKLEVIDLIIFDSNPKKMGKSKISIPKGFYKLMVNTEYEKDFTKCFYYENLKKPDLKNDKLKNHEVDCSIPMKLLFK